MNKIKVSYDVKNTQNGSRFGFLSTRTKQFETLEEVAKFIRKIPRGINLNGYVVYSDPTIE